MIELPLFFKGYGPESELFKRDAEKEDLENQIANIFDIPAVKYINIRNAEAGCFISRIEKIND